ncbi:MAG TPA: protein kinase [Rhodanobacteraceae bacterium]|nr:protein kinase [Rhodanobacteraceae bacterium]
MTHDAAVQAPATSSGAATLTGLTASSELHPGDLLGGRFRIVSLLGIGGMGVVYRARDLSLDIDVAIKLLRPELARRPGAFERFRSELLLARQVSSPHVVRIHDIAEHDGRWFISMDFIDGESLEGYRDRVGKIPLDGALSITRGLFDGLSAAHQRGVIHRDLKPANVLLDAGGHAYITDFGVARSLGATGVTQSGVIVGTPEYLSPEQARGEVADARSDLYTAGLILFEMLTGTLPFAGGTPAETVIQRIVRAPPSLARARPDLPRWLHALSDRLLKINPGHRFASAKDVLRAMETKRVPRPPLNRRAIFLVVLALVAIASVGTYLWRHPLPLRQLIAPVIPATPRVAVMPFAAPDGDADLGALARALEAHVHEWLRTDPNLAVVSRDRVHDAVARTAPGVSGDALAKLMPGIVNAAGANRSLVGSLKHDGNGLEFDLVWTNADGPATPRSLAVKGADAAGIFASYTKTLADSLRGEGVRLPAPPPIAPSDLAAFGRGLVALDQHEPEQAAKELSAAANAPPPSALITLNLLDAEEQAHQDLPAQNTRDTALKTFAQDQSPAAGTLRARSEAASKENNTKPTELAQAIKDFPHDPELVLQNAKALEADGEGAQAIALLKDFVKTDDQDARAWFLLGRASIVQGQVQQAVEDYLVRALVLNSRAGDLASEAETRNAQGIGFERLGQLDYAIEQYTRAADIREKIGDKRGMVKSLSNLAIAQAVKGDRESAKANLDKVKQLLEGMGDRASLADLYNNRGVVAEEQGDFKEALALYREALAIRQQLDEPSSLAESLNNVGFASYQIGRFDDAFAFWQQALALYHQLDDSNREIGIAQDLGLLDIARGHFAAARERMETSLATADANQLVEEAAVAHTNLSELALLEGSFADASTHIARAEEAFKRRSDRRGQIEANLIKARIALTTGDAAAVDAALAAIPADGEISNEQRAAFLLAGARRAYLGGDRTVGGSKLDAAAKVAAESHLGVLDFRIRIERARQALATNEMTQANTLLNALHGETTLLGQVPLRLELLELQAAAALRAGRKNDAANEYRETLPFLKDTGRYVYATILHGIGARALPDGGADASAAKAAAVSTRTQVLADAPPQMKASLEKQIDERLQGELGDAH